MTIKKDRKIEYMRREDNRTLWVRFTESPIWEMKLFGGLLILTAVYLVLVAMSFIPRAFPVGLFLSLNAVVIGGIAFVLGLALIFERRLSLLFLIIIIAMICMSIFNTMEFLKTPVTGWTYENKRAHSGARYDLIVYGLYLIPPFWIIIRMGLKWHVLKWI